MESGTTPKPYRELTFAALALGVVQGAIMTASFVYIGLKLGFGLPGVKQMLADRFGIAHSTLELECAAHACDAPLRIGHR